MSMVMHITGCEPSGCDGSSKPTEFPKPDPLKFTIISEELYGPFTLVELQYDGCTNYEGHKLLLYKNVGSVRGVKRLDPHFCNHPDCVSPIARFEPTDEGRMLAMLCIAGARRVR